MEISWQEFGLMVKIPIQSTCIHNRHQENENKNHNDLSKYQNKKNLQDFVEKSIPSILIVGMQISTAIMESIMKVLQTNMS